jgi:major vault protein
LKSETKVKFFSLCEFKNSASIIRASVFGLDENNRIRKQFFFPQNNLVITSIDIQSVEPVDQRTRDSLQKSVQLAIEITTNSQEAAAKYCFAKKSCNLNCF